MTEEHEQEERPAEGWRYLDHVSVAGFNHLGKWSMAAVQQTERVLDSSRDMALRQVDGYLFILALRRFTSDRAGYRRVVSTAGPTSDRFAEATLPWWTGRLCSPDTGRNLTKSLVAVRDDSGAAGASVVMSWRFDC